MARCDYCFREKGALQSPIPGSLNNAQVCKGCSYEIDKVIGFLAHYGWMLGDNPPTPQQVLALGQETSPLKGPRRDKNKPKEENKG